MGKPGVMKGTHGGMSGSGCGQAQTSWRQAVLGLMPAVRGDALGKLAKRGLELPSMGLGRRLGGVAGQPAEGGVIEGPASISRAYSYSRLEPRGASLRDGVSSARRPIDVVVGLLIVFLRLPHKKPILIKKQPPNYD